MELRDVLTAAAVAGIQSHRCYRPEETAYRAVMIAEATLRARLLDPATLPDLLRQWREANPDPDYRLEEEKRDVLFKMALCLESLQEHPGQSWALKKADLLIQEFRRLFPRKV